GRVGPGRRPAQPDGAGPAARTARGPGGPGRVGRRRRRPPAPAGEGRRTAGADRMSGRGDRWARVRAARLPAAGLGALAPVRCHPGVTVLQRGETVWVFWPAGSEAVLRRLRPVAGAEFFEDRGGRWHRFGSRLPCADGPPDDEGGPLDRALVPDRLEWAAPSAAVGTTVVLRVVRGGAPRPGTALPCRVADLARWADMATAAAIATVRAARCGERALLRGERLPVVAGAERFWGGRVLVPAGYRPEPELSEDVLRAACGVAADELLLLDRDGA